VARVMKPPDEVLSADLTVAEAIERLHAAVRHCFVVVDKRGVIGVVNSRTLEEGAAKNPEQKLQEIVGVLSFPHVHADQGLDRALERMGANHVDLLPVVNRGDIYRLEGIVTLSDVLNAYQIAVEPTQKSSVEPEAREEGTDRQ
jgi:CBS domain-containing protein